MITNIVSHLPVVKTVANAAELDTSLISELTAGLEKLKGALASGSHDQIHPQAEANLALLKAILNSPYSENFKNSGYFGSWASYLSPLSNLATLLEQYLTPGLISKSPTLSRLSQALTPAESLVKDESQAQTGMVAKLVSCVFNQGKREIQKLTSNTSSNSDEEILHPILSLQRVIGTIRNYGKDYLPSSQEKELAKVLRHLDQTSSLQTLPSHISDEYLTSHQNHKDLFSGIEKAIYQDIKEGKLHLNLEELIQKVAAFILDTSIQRDEKILDHFYQLALGRGKVGYFQSTSDITAQRLWSQNYLKEHGLQLETIEILMSAAAERDQIRELEILVETINPVPTHANELSYNLEIALHFFKKHPEGKLHQDVLSSLVSIISQWFELSVMYLDSKISPSELLAVENALNKALQLLNRGEYIQSLEKLKETLEKSPLAKSLNKTENNVSALNALSELKTKQESSAANFRKNEKIDWEKSVYQEKKRFVSQVSFLSTFKTIFNLIETDSAKSDQIYGLVMGKVSQAHQNNQRSVFIHELKAQIDERTDISFFRKQFIKTFAHIIFGTVRFFTNLFIHSFVDYLTNTVSLPTKEPLSTLHLTPIRRINESLIAQGNALGKWSSDTHGQIYGATGKKAALEKELKKPQHNHGYEPDELIKKTTNCAIDQFLNMGCLSSFFAKWNHRLELWSGRAITTNPVINVMGYAAKRLLTLAPRIILTIGYILSKLLEIGTSKSLKIFTKLFLNLSGIPKMILDSTKDSLYKQNQYTNAIDGVLLEQLIEIEKLLDQPGAGTVGHEGSETKNEFREMIANLFLVIDYNKHLTKSQLQANADLDSSIKMQIDTQLQGAIVQLIITVYRSILTEDQMKSLVHKLLQSLNDSFTPSTPIQMYFSAQEKEELATQLNRQLTDDDLKAQFLKLTGLKATDEHIKAQMLFRFHKTEEELKEVTHRVIQKSVHNTVEKTKKDLFMKAHESVTGYIDWMDRQFFKNGLSSGVFFRNAQKGLENPTPEAIQKLHGQLGILLEEFKEVQQQLDSKGSSGKEKTKAHMRRLNEITNTAILPLLKNYQEALQNYIHSSNKIQAKHEIQNVLDQLNESIYRHQAELERMREREKHVQAQTSTVQEKAVQWFSDKIKDLGETGAMAAENYANNRLDEIALGVFGLYKNQNSFEAFLRHVVLLNFVESLGYKKAYG